MLGGSIGGGAATVASNFIRSLTLLNSCEIFIITNKNMSCDINNARVIEFDFPQVDKGFLDAVENHIKENNYDCVFSFLHNNVFYNSFLQCHSFKYRCQNNPLIIQFFKKIIGINKINTQREVFKNYNKKCKLIAMSEKIKNDYVKNFKIPPENIIVVHPRAQINDNYHSCERKDKICFGVVANSSINKGGHILTFALGILNILGYKFNFKIIAPKYKNDYLLKFFVHIFHLKNNIEVFDKQENMENFYKSVDCLVLPSVNEAFGLVVLEAMTYSKLVLVSSTAGVSEIIDNNINGFVYNRKSFKDFIAKLQYIIKTYQNDFELFQKITKQGYITSTKYNWENFTLNVIKNIINDF